MNLVRRQTAPSWIPSLVEEWLQRDTIQYSAFQANQRPAVNIQETEKAFILDLAAPGFNKKDLVVTVENDLLLIGSEVETNDESDTTYTRREYSYKGFRRTFSIPENVEQKKIEAHYNEGVLKITLPKKEVDKVTAERTIRVR